MDEEQAMPPVDGAVGAAGLVAAEEPERAVTGGPAWMSADPDGRVRGCSLDLAAVGLQGDEDAAAVDRLPDRSGDGLAVSAEGSEVDEPVAAELVEPVVHRGPSRLAVRLTPLRCRYQVDHDPHDECAHDVEDDVDGRGATSSRRLEVVREGGPFESLRAFLDQEEAEDRFSGTVVIERGAETILAGAYGHAHLGLGVRNQLDTRFNLASITKMFTAVAVLQLVEEGRLSLDATVDDYLPELGIGMADRMTVHHLLCHQSGLGSYWNEKCKQRRSVLRTTADYLSLIGGEQPAFEPGTSVAYGNSGYLLLGGIIERASGEDYYDYLRQHVCRPAGMPRAGHLHLDHIEDFAHGYTHIEWEGPEHPEYRVDNVFQYPVHGSAAASLYSSAPELIQFGRALRANELLGGESVSLMLGQPQSPGLGYGTQWIPYSQGVGVGHGGRAFGAATLLLFLPEVDYTVCILSNYDRPADKRVFSEFDRILADLIQS